MFHIKKHFILHLFANDINVFPWLTCICEQFLSSRTSYNLVQYYFYLLNINIQKARNGGEGNYNPITSEVEVGEFS